MATSPRPKILISVVRSDLIGSSSQLYGSHAVSSYKISSGIGIRCAIIILVMGFIND